MQPLLLHCQHVPVIVAPLKASLWKCNWMPFWHSFTEDPHNSILTDHTCCEKSSEIALVEPCILEQFGLYGKNFYSSHKTLGWGDGPFQQLCNLVCASALYLPHLYFHEACQHHKWSFSRSSTLLSSWPMDALNQQVKPLLDSVPQLLSLIALNHSVELYLLKFHP